VLSIEHTSIEHRAVRDLFSNYDISFSLSWDAELSPAKDQCLYIDIDDVSVHF
jgi:hypothetical protein